MPRRSLDGSWRRWALRGTTTGAVVLALLAAVGPASADGPTTFSNTTAIAVPAAGSANQIGPAAPYPSGIAVSGMAGTVSGVTVTLNAVSHSVLNDVDALLVAPSGANLVLLSDAGGASLALASNAALTFSDSAAGPVPAGNIPTGTYKPTNNDSGPPDSFPAPAPAPSTQTTLAGAFSGIAPNGTWQLYVVDDATGDLGSFAGGWSLTLTTTVSAVATTTTVTSSGTPATTGTPVTFTATVRANGSPVTSGSVQFSDGATNLGSPVTLSPSGTATLTTSALAEGTHTIRATYSGATGFLTSNGTVSQRIDNPTVIEGNTFCNTGPLIVPANGPATPYPSNITVSGLTGTITDVTARLNGISHAVPVDLDVLLSSATSNLILLSDAGGTSAASNVDLTFDDAATSSVTSPLATGSYRPTDDDSSGLPDTFPAPAPASSGATSLATFDGAQPNGTWSLWVNDDATGDAGSVAGGWCLTVTTTSTVVADAVAGGPYAVAEGSGLRLDGSGSTPTGSSYAWDVNGDGVADATGIAPTLSWAKLGRLGIDDGPAAHQVRLTVTAGSSTDTATADLTVANRAPTVTAPRKVTGKAGRKVRIRVRVTDPSPVDRGSRFDYAVRWKPGTKPVTVRGSAGITLAHRYTRRGTYRATIQVSDKDGGLSAIRTVRIKVKR